MIAIKLGENNRVDIIHHVLEGVDVSSCILLESDLPIPQNIIGKNPILMYDEQTKQLYYEYEDRPLTKEEQFEQRIELLQQALDDILLNGGAL